MAKHRHYDAGKNSEWYTPSRYVESARQVMVGIDLDPASCTAAQGYVKAGTFFTRYDDGLTQPWHGRVWLNPPYSDYRGQAADWAAKLLTEYLIGNVSQAVMLVNLSVVYQADFLDLARYSTICLVDHRIKFVDQYGHQQRNAPQANAFYYLGHRADQFAAVFAQYGAILQPHHRWLAVSG